MNTRKHDLTGRVQLRPAFFGRLVVQVECRAPDESPGTFHCWWRDATAADLAQLVYEDRGGLRSALQALIEGNA